MSAFPPPPGLGCSHPACDKWGSVRWYIPRGLAKPDVGPLYCVGHCEEHRPDVQAAPAAPAAPPMLAARISEARQGAFL